MDDCVFCKIVSGEIEDMRVWEDDKYVAFLDINPFSHGHTLVIPKKHSRWIWDLSQEEYVDYFLAARKVSAILKRAYDTDCVQMIIAGMDVPHAHIHLLPRTKDDGLPALPTAPISPKPSEEDFVEIMKKIKE